jgi:hypothetical protein
VEYDRAHNFILGLSPNTLDHLTWRNRHLDLCSGECSNSSDPLIEEVLRLQGASLRALDIQGDETTTAGITPLSLRQLRELTVLAPKLKQLTLNLARTKDDDGFRWPEEELLVIAEGFVHLVDLTIHFELPSQCPREMGGRDYWSSCSGTCVGPDEYAKPLLNETSAKAMIKLLARHKAGDKLERVAFRAGDWTHRWDGPLYEPDWIESLGYLCC